MFNKDYRVKSIVEVTRKSCERQKIEKNNDEMWRERKCESLVHEIIVHMYRRKIHMCQRMNHVC